MTSGASEPDLPPPPGAPPGPASPRGGGRARFATTRWSMVLAAAGGRRDPGAGGGQGRGPVPSEREARDALAELCRSYWYPLYAYVRARGQGVEQAQDLTQAFFARLLEKGVLRAADPRRGRFRSFLLTGMKNFLANERDRDNALKRGGGKRVLPLGVCFDEGERRYTREPAHTLTPDRLFERGWAVTLLDAVLRDLQAQYAAGGRGELFDRLKPYLAGDADAPPYAKTAAEAAIGAGAVQVAVHRLRKRYRALLRLHIGQTVQSPEEVEEEIRDLFRAVRG